MIEAQSKCIYALMAEVLRARQVTKSLTIAPKKERLEECNDETQKKLSTSSFAHPSCRSWYENEEGVITNN